MASKKNPKVIKGDGLLSLPNILIFIGGVASVIAGLCSIALGVTLIQITIGWGGISGPILPYIGFIGMFGGLIALYGMIKKKNHMVILGGVLGVASPSFLSVLTVIGGLLMKVRLQKRAIDKLLTYPKSKLRMYKD